MSDGPKRFVYIPQSINVRARHYTGLTDNIPRRLEEHTVGRESMKAPNITTYLIGDAGYDTFTLTTPRNRSRRSLQVPSGTFFMRDVLPRLLGPGFQIRCLVSEARGSHSGEVTPTPAKSATLKVYDDGVTRIEKYVADRLDSKQKALSLQPPEDPLPERSLLVAHHAGESWNSSSDAARSLSDFVNRFAATDSRAKRWPTPDLPRILVNLSDGLPKLSTDARAIDDDRPFKSFLWNILFAKRDQVGLVVSISALRAAGVAISRRLSWEQGVEDLGAELHLFPVLRVLSRFRHLFVRVGMIGFLHIECNNETTTSRMLRGDVYFNPYAREGIHRDQQVGGTTIGKNTMFIAALMLAYRTEAQAGSQVPEPKTGEGVRPPLVSCLRDVVKRSLKAIRVVDDAGYDRALFGNRRSGKDLVLAPADRARPLLHHHDRSGPEDPKDILGHRPIPDYLLVAPPPHALRVWEKWHILIDVLLTSPIHRINVAMAIVKGGHEQVLNRIWERPKPRGSTLDEEIWNTLTRVERWSPKDRAPDFVTLQDDDWPSVPEGPADSGAPTRAVIGDIDKPFELNIPVMTFEALTLIERDEIETFRAISNLLRGYRTSVKGKMPDDAKPLSIAVFGPPGSGKSFGVKQIAKTLGKEDWPILEFNIGQFSGPAALPTIGEALRTLRGKLKGKHPTPIVFFDEFDSPLHSVELGWLKYFLAPMQDGKLDGQPLGPALFVFAGGVHSSFERFDPSTDSSYNNRRDSVEYKRRWKHFVAQKGPDFTSRLRGHINVLPINDTEGRIKHFMRRSVQLRSVLSRAGYAEKNGSARIDDAIVYALLTVDRYRHGVRSMEAIIEMCSPIHGKIEIASLPSSAQLDMHVDAEEFFIRVYRGRVRALPEWKPSPTEEYDWAVRTLRENILAAQAERPSSRDIELLKNALRSIDALPPVRNT